MRDLTQGPVPKHILTLAAPIAMGMLFQNLYHLVDLYFVAQIGDAAVAGVSAAGNLQFVIFALTQVLGVGTMALISHAVGQKDRDDANLIFNQSLFLAALCATITLVGGYLTIKPYMRQLGADPETMAAGVEYILWFLPGLALQFALVAMGSALRGTGIANPTMVVQVFTVLLNAVLSPIMIAGWGTGHPMGVAGAGLASTISVAVGVVLLGFYFFRLEKYVGLDTRQLWPRFTTWGRILKIGIPPGGEFLLIFVYIGMIYWVTRDFGAEAQAGFGVGSRVMQAIFLPAMAIAFATAPVAGQNFGAGLKERVKETFRSAAWMGSALMLTLTIFCQWRPELPIRGFTDDPEVVAIGAQFLNIISWNFVASGLIFTCSGMFQALGNTIPSVISSATRLVTFVAPAIWLSKQPDFTLKQLWLLSVASVALHALTSLGLLKLETKKRLEDSEPAAATS